MRALVWASLFTVAALSPSTASAQATDVTHLELMVDRFNAKPMQLLDVRSAEEFHQGHIKGAVNIPHTEIAQVADSLEKDAPIVVYCRSGRRAQIAIEAMQELGYSNLYHLQGDMLGWQELNLPQISAKDKSQ